MKKMILAMVLIAITAFFVKIATNKTYNLTVGKYTASIEGKVIGTSGVYTQGTEVTVEAIPTPNMKFSHWTDDAVGTENPLTVTVDSDKEIDAVFETADHIKPFTGIWKLIKKTVIDGYSSNVEKVYDLKANTLKTTQGSNPTVTNSLSTTEQCNQNGTIAFRNRSITYANNQYQNNKCSSLPYSVTNYSEMSKTTGEIKTNSQTKITCKLDNGLLTIISDSPNYKTTQIYEKI